MKHMVVAAGIRWVAAATTIILEATRFNHQAAGLMCQDSFAKGHALGRTARILKSNHQLC